MSSLNVKLYLWNAKFTFHIQSQGHGLYNNNNFISETMRPTGHIDINFETHLQEFQLELIHIYKFVKEIRSHSSAAHSIAASQLQGHWFNPKQGLLYMFSLS